jgi:hypothetical protein
MTVTTPRPTLSIAAAAVMTASITVFALLGVHIQILCLQFIYVILNHLKISRRFELAGKIWNRICELQMDLEGIWRIFLVTIQQKY